MGKLVDILLVSTISFGCGWIFGPQIVNWTSQKIDETVPQIKDKLNEAKKENNKKMENKDLKIPEENIITVQDFGSCGYWTYDIKNNFNLPVSLMSLEGKWYIAKVFNNYVNGYKIKNQSTYLNEKQEKMLIPEYYTINIVQGTDYYIKNYLLPKPDIYRYVVNCPQNINEKFVENNKELQKLLEHPMDNIEQILEIVNPKKEIHSPYENELK